MGQQRLARPEDSGSGKSGAGGPERWRQPQLLASRQGRGRGGSVSERRREAGLIGIAEARAALAEAARRAQARAEAGSTQAA